VVEDALVAVVHLVPALREPEAKVGVFEAVAEDRVEAADGRELAPPHEHARAGHDPHGARAIDGGVVRREADVEVPRVAVVAERGAGVLDGAVREQELRADDGRFAMAVGVRHERVEPAFARQRVVVEKDDEFACRHRGAGVARLGEACRGVVPQNPHAPVEAAERRRRPVRRAVVYDDEFVRDTRLGRQDPIHAPPGQERPVVGGKDDGAAHAHAGLLSEKITQLSSSATAR
jgi:hypothetical protein